MKQQKKERKSKERGIREEVERGGKEGDLVRENKWQSEREGERERDFVLNRDFKCVHKVLFDHSFKTRIVLHCRRKRKTFANPGHLALNIFLLKQKNTLIVTLSANGHW